MASVYVNRPGIGKRLAIKRVRQMVNRIEPFLTEGDRVLDLGAGMCLYTYELRQKGFQVTPVDIKNRSIVSSVTPILYDGETLPYPNNAFDTCLLVAVLHHTKNPEKILSETARVSRKLIVRENIYTNTIQKYYTYCIDSILNKEFRGHPHTNKTDASWKKMFTHLGLRLEKVEYSHTWGYMLDGTYYLTRSN